MNRVKVVGIGSEFMGDDAAGLVAARKLRQHLKNLVEVLEVRDPSNLYDVLIGADIVILIDASKSGRKPGTIYRVESLEALLDERCTFSTHSLQLKEVLSLMKILGTLPGKLVLYGVEGARFERGGGLSEEVENAVDRLVNLVLKEVCSLLCSSSDA